MAFLSLRIDLRATREIVSRARAKVEANANRVYRAQVFRMFEDLLFVSPQYSGDYVSNWRVVTHAGDAGSYQPWYKKGSVLTAQVPNKAGDPEAIVYARDVTRRQPFTWRDKLYFVNETPLVFTSTTVTGPDGVTHPLRAENLIPEGVAIQNYLKAKYGGR